MSISDLTTAINNAIETTTQTNVVFEEADLLADVSDEDIDRLRRNCNNQGWYLYSERHNGVLTKIEISR